MQTQSSNSKANTTPVEAIQNWLVNQLASQLSLDTSKIKVSEPLTRYGLDSIDAVTMVGDLEDWLELELPSTLFWDYPTIEKSAQYLAENYDIPDTITSAELTTEEIPQEKSSKKEESQPASNGKGWGGFFKK